MPETEWSFKAFSLGLFISKDHWDPLFTKHTADWEPGEVVFFTSVFAGPQHLPAFAFSTLHPSAIKQWEAIDCRPGSKTLVAIKERRAEFVP